MFINTGDFAMPSVAVTLANFVAQNGFGTYGEELYANLAINPAEEQTRNIVVYYDSSDGGESGGAVRTLSSGNAWYVDRVVISSMGSSSSQAITTLRNHVNFLCSVRSHPVLCPEDNIWYRIIHVALIGRITRPGKTANGMDVYQAALQVKWRPMSAKDEDYEKITGIKL